MRGWRRKQAQIGLVAMVLASTAGVAAEPIAVVERYFAANGDSNAIAALLTDDAVWVDGDGASFSGEQLRDRLEFESAMQQRLQAGAMRVDEDGRVIVDGMTERSRLYDGMGIGEVRYQNGVAFTLNGDKIARIDYARPEREFAMAIYLALRELTYWAREDHLAELNAVMPMMQPVYDAGTAQQWKRLLDGWQASKLVEAAGAGS